MTGVSTLTARGAILTAGTDRPWGDYAVLYRSHYQSLEVQLALTRAGIPFFITSGLRFFEQAHIKDVAAFIRLTHGLERMLPNSWSPGKQ